jgi:oligopeptidase B
MTRSAWLAALVLVGCGSAAPARAPSAPSNGPVGAPSAPAPAAPSADETALPPPPAAAQRAYAIKAPGGERNDPYYWLRDDTRKDPDVLGFLEAENTYTRAVLGPDRALEDQLLGELKRHVQDDDTDVPTVDDHYAYYARYTAGQEQPVIARHKIGAPATPGRMHNHAIVEEVVLDGNELAKGHAFFALGGYAVSRNGQYVAWLDDGVGRRQFVLHIKDLRTGKLLADTATNVSGGGAQSRDSVVWANDNQTVFYVGKDATTLREDRVFRHGLGQPHDAEVFREADGQYYVHLAPTKSRRYIAINLVATSSNETQLIDADHPRAPIKVALPRETGHLYELDHLDGKFIVRTNAGAKNFRLVEVAEAKLKDRAAWRDVIAASSDVLVENFTVSRSFTAATVRTGGLSRVQVVPSKGPAFLVDADEAAYTMRVDDVPDPDARDLRYQYTSPVTPRTTFELDVTTRHKTALKVQPVPGYDASQYAVAYVHAKASDGTPVPITVVARKDTKRDGTAPMLVYGYGSYGASMDPTFDASRLALLDRGWVWAIAHIRGGQEMGRAWYEDGKLMHKRNTFTDFIAATEYLVGEKYAARDQVFALGRSAGGLLMGAILNMRPDLYRGVVAGVPFVDAVTTMLDESIPLTTNEFDEWGNPKDKAAYDYMLTYSPYDNVKPQAYPSIFVTTSLWDSQVQYFEPAKWVAKLRATKTDHNVLLLETDMAAGHGGKSGRFDRLRDTARYMTFLLHVLAHHDARSPSVPQGGTARASR